MSDQGNQALQQAAEAAIRDDHLHGAAELARQALVWLSDYAQRCQARDAGDFCAQLDILVRRLGQARPSMVVLTNVVAEWQVPLGEWRTLSLAQARRSAIERAETVAAAMQQARECAVRHCVQALSPGAILMTHSRSSAIVDLFQACAAKQLDVRAIITESRPGQEGQLLARELDELGIGTEFITDAQMAVAVPRADQVVIGADSVLADGTVINKTGSALLALAAREAGVPLRVLTDRYKYSGLGVDEVEYEQGAPAELGLAPLTSVQVRNQYFEPVPPRLIDAWIDEDGIHPRWLGRRFLASR